MDDSSPLFRAPLQVLIETAQLRREQATAGPRAELVYWRHVLACYMAIVEQIKAPKCRLYVQLLTLAHSKLLKDWQELDQRVTNACNEADDNVKYLYALERYCYPLYHADPTVMGMHLPALLYTVRMVYASSRFYNSTERITSLLVKVTNQMVAACRAYLDENGARSVWEQRKRDVLHKIDVCLNLHKTYSECFEKARRAMLNTPVASDQPFEISEMYVFGKFQTFRIRIMKLAHALKIALKYSILESSCIEGIDAHAHRFKELYTQVMFMKEVKDFCLC
ncbi:hypothetical protein R5R35_000324 [Gryllus longicercus]|uniref:Dynein heavy chain tail domain-containing protein n=1 Tax=Gryllus longicercus TaxID=2509291 RepID=A0AAN9Z965_9ORTH